MGWNCTGCSRSSEGGITHCRLQHKSKSMLQEMAEICPDHVRNMFEQLFKTQKHMIKTSDVGWMRASVRWVWSTRILKPAHLFLVWTRQFACADTSQLTKFTQSVKSADKPPLDRDLAKSQNLPCQGTEWSTHSLNFPMQAGCHKIGDNFAQKMSKCWKIFWLICLQIWISDFSSACCVPHICCVSGETFYHLNF